MADIAKRAFVRHLRSNPTAYIQRMRKGRLVSEGTGLAFWFRPLGAAISELPVDEQELPLLFRARTSDFQEVAVQATITYRIAEPSLAVGRIDFSIDNDSGHWTSNPLEQVGGLLTELAQQYAVGVLAERTLEQVVASGMPELRAAISAGLQADDWLRQTGVEVVGLRVVAVRPDADIEKALQTPIREQLQQESDRATYERRARAVEQERAISENELQNQIELAKREQQLVAQQGANERGRATERAEAERIRLTADAEGVGVTAAAEAEQIRLVGSASAEAERALVASYTDLDHATIAALALRQLAGNLPDVDTLVVTPDLITSALTRLTAA